MSATDLRIQLEGKYEVVEAEVARWERAAAALRRNDWDAQPEWTNISPSTQHVLSALTALRKRERHGDDEAHLVMRLECARERALGLLDLRLRGLGERCDAMTVQMKLHLVRAHLPVALAMRLVIGRVDLRAWLSFLGGMVLTWLSRSVAGMLIVPVLATVLLTAFELEMLVAVTQRVLIVAHQYWRLDDLARVRVVKSWLRRHSHLIVQTKSGETMTWTIYSDASDLIETLRQRGIDAVGL